MEFTSLYPGLTLDAFDRINSCELGRDYNLEGRSFYAKCVRVKDGDTIQLAFYLDQFCLYPPVQYTCRLEGIDTPEKRPKKSNPNRDKEKAKAKKASEFTSKCVDTKIVYVNSGGWDMYGRLLATIWFINDKNVWTNLNRELLRLGHAKVYDGGTKPSWS